jgi:hypothetical protein
VLADWMGMPMVDLRDFTPDPDALRRVPRALAERGPVLPLALRDDLLVVAMADPWHQPLVDELRFASGVRVLPVAAARAGAVGSALLRAYGVALPGAAARRRTDHRMPRPTPAPPARQGLHELAAELLSAGQQPTTAKAWSRSPTTRWCA